MTADIEFADYAEASTETLKPVEFHAQQVRIYNSLIVTKNTVCIRGAMGSVTINTDTGELFIDGHTTMGEQTVEFFKAISYIQKQLLTKDKS